MTENATDERICYTKSMFITVDTGATKTLVAGFTQGGRLETTTTFPTPKNPNEYLSTLQTALQSHFRTVTVKALVIALPGVVEDGVALWCPNLAWKNFAVHKALKHVFQEAPLLIENDANLAGIAETRALNPLSLSSLYVTIGTGIGTSIITNGHIDPGLRYSEGGHALVEFEGQAQEWESFASGRAIYATYGKYAHDITNQRTWDQIADRISRGFLAIIPLLQPQVVIIGGGIGTHFTHYGKQLEAILREKLPPHISLPRFRQAEHPEQAVVYGCYYYALDYLTHHQATD